jgi:hypothetical protein
VCCSQRNSTRPTTDIHCTGIIIYTSLVVHYYYYIGNITDELYIITLQLQKSRVRNVMAVTPSPNSIQSQRAPHGRVKLSFWEKADLLPAIVYILASTVWNVLRGAIRHRKNLYAFVGRTFRRTAASRVSCRQCQYVLCRTYTWHISCRLSCAPVRVFFDAKPAKATCL